MATAVSTVGAVSRVPLGLHGSSSGALAPTSAFFGCSLKKTNPSLTHGRVQTGSFKVMAVDLDETKQTEKDRWGGLIKDASDDQQDITRGKGMVDPLFQAPMGDGTHEAVLSSYEYISQGLREFNFDNVLDGFYIAPEFMDKLVVHITKNYMDLPNIKVPLILGIWGGKGQGKSFQCELVFRKMGINPIMMSAGELESGNAGEPAKLIRQRYREAADIIAKGKMCCLFINDLDAGAGRMGGTTQYTVNNQMVNATLMNIADNPTNVQLPGMYNKQENARVPIIVTGNDFSTLYAPLIRDGRMEKYYWAPTRDDRIGVCIGIFRTDNVPDSDIVKLVDAFPGQSIDFFGALRARVYDDEVRKWVGGIGVEKVGKRLVNSIEGPPTFEQPKMTLEKLMEYGNMLVQEQENVKRVQLADKYLSEAALGDANEDAILPYPPLSDLNDGAKLGQSSNRQKANRTAMASTKERLELAKLCSSRNWSKAIRVLDSLLSQSISIQDLCNRAFCYSQLELNKHVIKDCDRALELDPTVLQAYILKGNALSALGRKEDALLVWEQGHENAVCESTDLKQLLELEELLGAAKQNGVTISENHPRDSSNSTTPVSDIKAVGEDHVDSSSSSTLTTDTESESQSKDAEYETQSKYAESETEIKSDDKFGINVQPRNSIEICNGSNGINKTSQNVFITKSISLDFRLSRGIAQVNEGKYDDAISIFNQILRENPTYPEALIGRGTAYAFQRELENAIADFSKAIKANSLAGEAWKRRGQARAALGESVEAIEDLTKALEFEPKSSDILHERGIVCYKFKDYDAAVADLSACVKRDKKNKSAYTYLGLALSAVGEYTRAEEAHLQSIRLDRNFLEGWAHLTQFYLDLASSEKALRCLNQVLLVDVKFAKAYHLRGLLHHGLGMHRTAIEDLSLGLSIESSNIECLYLRGSCYHAIGEYGDAIKDYDAVLDIELDSMDKFVLQCLAFYQKEIALYTASKFTSEFCWFDIDRDIDPLFKEYWCKKLHPKYVCERVFRQPPLRDSLKKGRLRKLEFVATKHKRVLLHAADSIGQKIQYNCPGFLPNRRQYRMAGLAAIEIAQKVTKAWRSMRRSNKNNKKAKRREKLATLSQNRGGAGCSTSSSSETSSSCGVGEDRLTSGRLSWQDVYNIAVKWRQISEPCDPVVWINKLSEEFNSGFGSHTPMLLGQAKVVRYFPNYHRILAIAKSIIMESKYANNSENKIIELSEPGKLQKIINAGSCSDLYDIIGENFWVATTCESTAFEGLVACTRKRLEGTRITVQKMDKRGFDFAIKTPCTPSRWAEYDAEMAIAWETLCNEYCSEAYGLTDLGMLEKVKDAILRMTYYWYNFMPLARGTAAIGYTVLLGLLLAINIEVTGNIPPGIQVDWEAILSSTPDAFLDSVKSWLDPLLRVDTSWKDYLDVASTFNTTGSVVTALSAQDV